MRPFMHQTHRWWGPIIERDPALADLVMGTIRERGALGSRDFEGEASGVGMWNNLKPAKRMLEALWNAGELVIAGRQGFQRLYDLPERVLPDAVLGAPVPDEAEVLQRLVVRAVRARGALTEAGVVEHWRLRGGHGPHPGARRGGRRLRGAAPGRRVRRRRAGARRGRCRPRGGEGDGSGAALALRQPALGPAVRRARARLPPPDRGLQARAGAALRLLRAAAARGRSHRRAAPTSAPTAARAR